MSESPATASPGPTLFLSYAAADEEFARSIADELGGYGFRTWFMTRDVRAGSAFTEEIAFAIREADALILLYSFNSARSKGCSRELALADDLDLPVIPIRLDATPLSERFSYLLAGVQWIDWQAPGGSARLLAGLHAAVEPMIRGTHTVSGTGLPPASDSSPPLDAGRFGDATARERRTEESDRNDQVEHRMSARQRFLMDHLWREFVGNRIESVESSADLTGLCSELGPPELVEVVIEAFNQCGYEAVVDFVRRRGFAEPFIRTTLFGLDAAYIEATRGRLDLVDPVDRLAFITDDHHKIDFNSYADLIARAGPARIVVIRPGSSGEKLAHPWDRRTVLVELKGRDPVELEQVIEELSWAVGDPGDYPAVGVLRESTIDDRGLVFKLNPEHAWRGVPFDVLWGRVRLIGEEMVAGHQRVERALTKRRASLFEGYLEVVLPEGTPAEVPVLGKRLVDVAARCISQGYVRVLQPDMESWAREAVTQGAAALFNQTSLRLRRLVDERSGPGLWGQFEAGSSILLPATELADIFLDD
ncbi:MAG TPA: toll/interleukin-1 receptor domain-containing protein [Propionicimonas sp.]|nr:toll/interleukin-1 receptor domain-containing protein [Propionicimonas sp.]